MDLGDLADKFNLFFRFTSWACRPFLERRHHPKERPDFAYHFTSFLIYLGMWLIVVIAYIAMVYLAFYEPADGIARDFGFLSSKTVIEILVDVRSAITDSMYMHSSFIVLIYLTIRYKAELDYFKPKVLHADLVGLIKVIKTGSFDEDSHAIEQNEGQVEKARKNILATVKDPTKEIVKILTSSGWDIFGEGSPLPMEQNSEKVPSKLKYIQNGYLLKALSSRSKSVEIIILDPDGSAVKERADQYLSNLGHRAIQNVEQYREGVRKCLQNLAIAWQGNKRIKVKLINTVPRWKVILVEGEVWVQPIMEGKRSDHTPLYGFKKSTQSIYHYFFNLVDSYWLHGQAKEVDLSSYLPSPSSNSKDFVNRDADLGDVSLLI